MSTNGGAGRGAMNAAALHAALLSRSSTVSSSQKGRSPKKQRTDNLAANVVTLATELESTGVPVQELAAPLKLFVALATLSDTSWWPADARTPIETARVLLYALLPVGGEIDFFETSIVLLGPMGGLGELRSDALRWIMLAHEALNCWRALQPARDLLLFYVRDPVLATDAAFALFRIGCSMPGTAAWLTRRELLIVHRIHRCARTWTAPRWPTLDRPRLCRRLPCRCVQEAGGGGHAAHAGAARHPLASTATAHPP